MSTVRFEGQSSNRLVPDVVSNKISRVISRARGLRLLSGACVAFASALVVLLVAIAVDWAFVLFDPAIRTQITMAALGAMAALALACLGIAVFKGLTTIDAAKTIDQQVPELMERWTSINEFSTSSDPQEMRGSETFINKVAEEAAGMENIVQPNSIRVGRHLTHAAYGLGIVLGIWMLLALADAGQVSVLVRRFVSPQSEISLTKIRSESGDIVQPRGSSLKIEGVTSGRPRANAELILRKEGEPEETIKLDAMKGNDNRFVLPVKNLQIPFAYRFRSGDGQSPWHEVRIADRPRISLVSLRIVPPAYSKLPELQQDGLPKSIKALQGSKLLLNFKSSIPLTSFVLQAEDRSEYPLSLSQSDDYPWELDLKESIAFRPILTSTEGLLNAQPPRCEIVVFRDQAPVVEVANPTNEVAVRPDDAVTITFDAKDDFGISKAELVIFDPSKPGDEELKSIPIPLGDQEGSNTVHAQIDLDLKQFNLKHGEQLNYAIRVFDTKDESATNQPGNPSSEESANQLANQDQKPNQNSTQTNDSKPNSDSPNQQQLSAENQANEVASNDSKQNDSQSSGKSSASKSGDSKSGNAQKDKKPDPKSDQSVASKESEPTEPPKDQLQGGNTWSPKSGKDDSKKNENGNEITGKPRPEFHMAKRELDTPAGQCTTGSKRRIKIDEWAGSFASKGLEKLELQIDPVLNELKAALTKARDIMQPLAKQQKTANQWKPDDSLVVRKGDELLDQSEGFVKDLNAKSDGTPYAFIGLQLRDIAQLHISPAREHLQDVTVLDRHSSADDLSASVVHIGRAIELLEKLTRQYEAAKLNQKLADTMLQIKKMHQIFLEGTFAMLKSQKPNLNPKERAFMELDLSDEFLEKLQALLQKKLEIQAELAKVLSKDPRLLQRFMARSRLEADTLRDQLTLVAQRHQALAADVKAGLPKKGDENQKLVLKNQHVKQADAAAAITEGVSKMFDNFVVWTPLDRDVDKGDLGKFKAKGVKLVAAAEAFSREAADEESKKSLDSSDALYEGIVDWEKTLPDLLGDDLDGKMQVHVANRMEEAQKLITDVSGWGLKQQSLESGDHHIAAEIEQHRITVDTMVLARKLTSVRAQCQGISVDLANVADEFLKTMEQDLVPELEESQLRLDENELKQAVKHQQKAIDHFAKAEELLDEVMDGIIKHLDSQPFNEKPDFPDGVEPESLEQLLAMLEEEARAAEALGIPCCRPSNLIVEKDWFQPGSMPGAGSGGGGGNRTFRAGSQMQQSKMASQKADRLRKQLEDALKKMAARGDGNSNVAPEKSERRWNTLGSKLEDHLRQGRGNLPPEQYRKAIERYFESLAGKSNSPKGD